MRCSATTVASTNETVQCKKDQGHTEVEETANHWAVTSAGKDVVWAEVTLLPPGRQS